MQGLRIFNTSATSIPSFPSLLPPGRSSALDLPPWLWKNPFGSPLGSPFSQMSHAFRQVRFLAMTLPHAKLSNSFSFFIKHKVWPSMSTPSQLSNYILFLGLHSRVLPEQPDNCPGHTSCSEFRGGPPRQNFPSGLRYPLPQLPGVLVVDGCHVVCSQMKTPTSPKVHIPFPGTGYIQWLVRRGGDSLLVQWLRLHTSTAGGPGSIPGQGTKIPQAALCGQKKKKKCVWGGCYKDPSPLSQGKATLKSYSSFRPVYEIVSGFLFGVAILQPSTFFCLILFPWLLHRRWSQGYSLIHFPNAKLHPRVCFLGNLRWNTPCRSLGLSHTLGRLITAILSTQNTFPIILS